jgi:hypothetical protein
VPYQLRAVDPLLVILGVRAILGLRARVKVSAEHALSSETLAEEAG